MACRADRLHRTGLGRSSPGADRGQTTGPDRPGRRGRKRRLRDGNHHSRRSRVGERWTGRHPGLHLRLSVRHRDALGADPAHTYSRATTASSARGSAAPSGGAACGVILNDEGPNTLRFWPFTLSSIMVREKSRHKSARTQRKDSTPCVLAVQISPQDMCKVGLS